jgi:SAM-dependent methyltransferase
MIGFTRAAVGRMLFRRGWDTRCRHRAPVAALRRAVADLPRTPDGPALLDVGCGKAGMAAFLPDLSVVGVDIDPPADPPSNLDFRSGSITDLPFADRAFPLVSCIDVIENLAPATRVRAIAEVVRVARHGVLIACPHGEVAERTDAEFRRALEARRRPVPDWVSEHEAYPFPTASAVVSVIRELQPDARIGVSFSEPIWVTRLVRGAAARSDLAYMLANLLFGVLLPLVPKPEAGSGYRMIVYADLR